MTFESTHRGRGVRRHRYASIASVCWSALVGLALASPTAAQYGYDPSGNGRNAPGIHYFGAAKDDEGSFLPGATITLDTEQGRYVFVTDDIGRFRGNLPIDLVPEKVSPVCFKVGFQLVRVTKRPGPEGPKATVQVDCVLRRASAG